MIFFLKIFCCIFILYACKSSHPKNASELSNFSDSSANKASPNDVTASFPSTGFVGELAITCNQEINKRWEGARYIRVGGFAAIIPTNHAQLPPLKKISIFQNIVPIGLDEALHESACKNEHAHEGIFPISIETLQPKDVMQLKSERLNPSPSGSYDMELEQIFQVADDEIKLHANFEQDRNQLKLNLSGKGLAKIRLRIGNYEDKNLQIEQNATSFEIHSQNSFWKIQFLSSPQDLRFHREKYFYFSAFSKDISSMEFTINFNSKTLSPNQEFKNSNTEISDKESKIKWWLESHSGLQIALPTEIFNAIEAKLKALSSEKKSLSIFASLKDLLDSYDTNLGVEEVICPNKFMPYTSFEAITAILKPKKWSHLENCEKFIPHFDLNSFIE